MAIITGNGIYGGYGTKASEVKALNFLYHTNPIYAGLATSELPDDITLATLTTECTDANYVRQLVTLSAPAQNSIYGTYIYNTASVIFPAFATSSPVDANGAYTTKINSVFLTDGTDILNVFNFRYKAPDEGLWIIAGKRVELQQYYLNIGYD